MIDVLVAVDAVAIGNIIVLLQVVVVVCSINRVAEGVGIGIGIVGIVIL
jgi:hypothetical protein